jgi:hypothetical protein
VLVRSHKVKVDEVVDLLEHNEVDSAVVLRPFYKFLVVLHSPGHLAQHVLATNNLRRFLTPNRPIRKTAADHVVGVYFGDLEQVFPIVERELVIWVDKP